MVKDEKNTKKRLKISYSKYMYITFYTAGVLVLLVVTVFETQADTLKFFFQNLVQVETIEKNEVDTETPLIQYEIHWNAFENEIPPDTLATKISLHFVFSSDIVSPAFSTNELVASSSETNFVEVQNSIEASRTGSTILFSD
jgi:hypothetical protein